MCGNVELVNSVFKNSQMGVQSISKLVGIVKDEKMLEELYSELEEYKQINERAKNKLLELGHEPEGINAAAKVSSDISVKINTIIDKTPSHIAEMMMQGNMMGIIKSIKVIKAHPKANKECLNLANDLLKHEQRNVTELKQFL